MYEDEHLEMMYEDRYMVEDRDELQLEGWDFVAGEEDEELPEWMTETCEHGLSAWLCEDPFNHYGSDM